MTVIKSADQIALMKEAGRISAEALGVGKRSLCAGVSTAAIDAKIREFILSQGAVPSFYKYAGFPGNSCISINDEVIHGIPGDRIVQEGDIVSIDVGACYKGYHGDNAATFEVGAVSQEKKKLLEVTQECLLRAVGVAVKGNRIGDIGAAVQQHAESNGFSVVREYIGHGVGRALHEDPEVPNFGRAGHGVKLVPGMTIAIEPMINAGRCSVRVLSNDWTVVTCDGKPSAHFEFTVAVTEGAPIILTDWRKCI